MRLSPAQRVAVARISNPAIPCILVLMASAVAPRAFGPETNGFSISGGLEMPIEEIAGRVIRRQPIFVQQKIVHVIRKNELLDLYALLAEARHQIYCLREIHIAVVIPVNEEDRRLPRIHRSYRRRIMRQLAQLRRNILSVPVIRRPVVYTMEVHTCREQIGIAPQAQRSQIAT